LYVCFLVNTLDGFLQINLLRSMQMAIHDCLSSQLRVGYRNISYWSQSNRS